METTTNTAAVNLTAGMTVRVAGLESLTALAADHTNPFSMLAATDLAAGLTHRIPCGTVKTTGPTITVAEVVEVSHEFKNLRAIRIRTTTGEIIEMSTRQKVQVVK